MHKISLFHRLVGLFVLTQPAALAIAQEAPSIISSVSLEGSVFDDHDRLLRFLDLPPGTHLDDATRERIAVNLEALGYELKDEREEKVGNGVRLVLSLVPQRLVRRIAIHGNWPLFEDEILRRLSLQSGSRLPADEELPQFLLDEAERVRKFLESDGYFGAIVEVAPRPIPGKSWMDLEVSLKLGRWFKLGQVNPEGNRAISNPELFRIFDHCCFRWGRFSIQRMRDDARRAEKVLRERGYPSARIAPDFKLDRDADLRTGRIRLPMVVNEKKKVEVAFVGNRAFSDRELREQITLFSSGAYDDVEMAESARAIQRTYQRRGYFEATVRFDRHRIGAIKDQVTFLVEEGPELRVRGVDFVTPDGSALPFSSDEIRNKSGVESRPFPVAAIFGLGEGGYVTSVQLQQDTERIREFFRSRGYPQVEIRANVARQKDSVDALGAFGAESAAVPEKRGDLFVRFSIVPGRQEMVESVRIEFVGEHTKTQSDVRSRMKIVEAHPYTEALFRDDAQRIVNLYKSSGRPYVEIDFSRTQWNEAHDRVALFFRIAEGPEVRFGEILVRGNFKTRRRVIVGDLPFKPGDRFDVSKLQDGEKNLQTHLIFNSAHVTPVGLAAKRNPVPVLVMVQERYLERFGSLALSAGAATDKLPNYVYVSAGWLWGNFLGMGSQLELRGDFGFSQDSFGASLRYVDVRAFGPGWRFDLTGFFRRELTFRLGRIDTYGASVGLTRFVTPAVRVFLRYDNYLAQVNVPFYRLPGSRDSASEPDNTHTAKLTTGVVWDRRTGADNQLNPLAPVRGWLLGGSVGWAFPSFTDNVFTNFWSSDNHFFVVAGQALGIVPFRLRHAEFTLLANLRYDQGFPIGASALPAVERFFAGGDTTTRGYDPDQLKTELVVSDIPPLSGQQGFRVIPQGGNLRILSTVEVQFPIAKAFVGLPWPWTGALFYDVGVIGDGFRVLGVSDFKHAVGLSLLRILTPVGPLSLEYAYPLNQGPAEERWKTNPWYSHFPGRIHFNWGIPLSRL